MLTDVRTSVITETSTRFIIPVIPSFTSVINRTKLPREFRIENKRKHSGQMDYSRRLRWIGKGGTQTTEDKYWQDYDGKNLKERDNLPDPDIDKTQLAVDSDKWRAVMNTIMNFWRFMYCAEFLA